MAYAVVHSRADQGLAAPPVSVEVDLANGLPGFTVVGMPETAVRESRDRVRSALLNSHFEFPDRRITVNLAPADLPKGGGRFDLPIALGILAASGQLPADTLLATEALGELALDGSLRPVRGCVAATLAATAEGKRVILPRGTAERAARVPDSRVLAARDLLSLCATLRGRIQAVISAPADTSDHNAGHDLAEVIGQDTARRALEITAAGGHNLLLLGPPGTGKSLLASCLPGILPSPSERELLEILALHDLQGYSGSAGARPFRSPHHSASAAALIGGGAIPRPGEVSLAHGGVLFLDELPEFNRHTLDMLREPLESGEIVLSRARCRLCYPARFQLIAAMNPCPCGYAGDPRRACRCTPARRDSYGTRVSGPLLDRFDLQLRMERADAGDLLGGQDGGESSAAVRERVRETRRRQLARQGVANAQLQGPHLMQRCALDADQKQFLEAAIERLQLSARSVHRCLRVARTIADMGGQEDISADALGEALTLRLDRPGQP